jgi:GTP-binding protein
MIPVIALVGRPNVGKSTLFNRLTRSRDALVADVPGLTRDRKYGDGRLGDRPFIVVDTGGLSGDREDLDALMAEQSWQAVEEADRIFFLVDGREGLGGADEAIAAALRRTGKPVALVVNKADGIDVDVAMAEFHGLGMGEPRPISAAHGRGVEKLLSAALADVPLPETVAADDGEPDDTIRVAVVGRPNVGKSTLINRILGEERVLAYDLPGTTRDSIFIPFEPVRARRLRLYPDRYGRCTPQGPCQRGDREVQCHQDTAGHCRRECRGAGAGCPGRDQRAGRDTGRLYCREGAGAGDRGQQVGWP